MTDQIQGIRTDYMSKQGSKQIFFWDYYRAKDGVIPIFKREPIGALEKETLVKTHVNFFKDVIDLKQGYMAEDIKITSEEHQKLLSDMLITSRMNTVNSQTCEYSSVEGLSHRLIYTENGIFRQKNLHGWQVVYIGNPFSPEKALYFYTLDKKEKNQDPGSYCNIYDKQFVYYYKEEITEVGGKKKVEWKLLEEKQEHNFSLVPVIPFPNTSNNDSNFKDSVKINNDYDTVLSDATGDIESTRGSYLVFKGQVQTGRDPVTKEEMPVGEFIKKSKSIFLPTDAEGKNVGDVSFLEKNINDQALVNQLQTLRAHVYELSGSVDLRELTSAERVFSIKASLMRLENNAKTTENYMKQGIYKVLVLWAEWIKEYNGTIIDPLDIKVQFERVFPVDSEAQADLFLKLVTYLSVEDSLKIAGYENADELAQRSNELEV